MMIGVDVLVGDRIGIETPGDYNEAGIASEMRCSPWQS